MGGLDESGTDGVTADTLIPIFGGDSAASKSEIKEGYNLASKLLDLLPKGQVLATWLAARIPHTTENSYKPVISARIYHPYNY